MRESMGVPYNQIKYNWSDIMNCNMSACWRKLSIKGHALGALSIINP